VDVTEESRPRWRRRPSERPSEILEAALAAFAENGLSGTRVEDIADRAGVSKGTIYLYFSSKEEIFKEAVRDKVARTVDALSEAAGPGEPLEQLLGFLDAYWRHLRRPAFASLYRLLIGELHQFPDLTRFYAEEVSGWVIDLTAGIIEDGVRDGQFRPVDPTAAGRMITGLLVQHALWASQRNLFTHLGNRTDDELLADIKDFAIHGLLTDGAAAGKGAR
jgi:AcrR family transcriptional regulator